jgi:hypothetical protein
MSVSANLETVWAETQASTSAKLTPTLRQPGAWQAMLWLPTLQVSFLQAFCVRTILSGMMVRGKTRSRRDLALPGSSCPVQVDSYSELDMASFIPDPPAKHSIKIY